MTWFQWQHVCDIEPTIKLGRQAAAIPRGTMSVKNEIIFSCQPRWFKLDWCTHTHTTQLTVGRYVLLYELWVTTRRISRTTLCCAIAPRSSIHMWFSQSDTSPLSRIFRTSFFKGFTLWKLIKLCNNDLNKQDWKPSEWIPWFSFLMRLYFGMAVVIMAFFL